MIPHPTPLQTLFLWRLLSCGGGGFQNELKPELKPKQRTDLERAGLISKDTRQKVQAGRRPTRANFITLTDLGWQWAAEHLDAPVSPRSPAAAPILQVMLGRLKNDLLRHRRSLAEFILETEPSPVADHIDACPPTDRVDACPVPDRVRAVYRELTGGRFASRVRLADLRTRLDDIPRDSLDRALLQMERDEMLVCYPLDDPRELYPADEQAALMNSAGQQRHAIYMEN